jgi:nitronate monooxygenase
MTQPSRSGFTDLLRSPIVVAPMAGGPSTADLVIAAARAGALAFLAGGYKSPEAMTAEIAAVRAATAEPFGVNVFVPGAPFADTGALERYLSSVRPAGTLGDATWDDEQPAGEVIERLCGAPTR